MAHKRGKPVMAGGDPNLWIPPGTRTGTERASRGQNTTVGARRRRTPAQAAKAKAARKAARASRRR